MIKKMTVMEIRNAKVEDLRQLAVAQMDENTTLREGLNELNIRIDAAFRQLHTPIPMILFCPSCGARHIDIGTFETKPHKSHSCQSCGFTWSPSHVPTVGVQFLPGYRDFEVTEVAGGKAK